MKTSTVVLVTLCLAGVVINVLWLVGGLPGWMMGEVPADRLQAWQRAALPLSWIASRLGGVGAIVLLYFAFLRR
jgi:hypothetical protein